MVRLIASLLLIVALLSPAAADVMVGPPPIPQNYLFEGVKNDAGYTFVVAQWTKHRNNAESKLSVTKLEEGKPYQPARHHWSTQLSWKIYAFKGDVPETITAEWLEKSNGISKEFQFAASVSAAKRPKPGEREDPFSEEVDEQFKDVAKITVTLALSVRTKSVQGDSIQELVVTPVRTVHYDKNGKDVRTIEPKQGNTPFQIPGDQGLGPRREPIEPDHMSTGTSFWGLLGLALLGVMGLAIWRKTA